MRYKFILKEQGDIFNSTFTRKKKSTTMTCQPQTKKNTFVVHPFHLKSIMIIT